jgi:hypothetical protein
MSAGACSVAVDSPRLEMTVAGPTVVLGQAKRHAEQRAVLAARTDVKDAIVFSKRGPRAVETVNRGNPPVRFFFCSDNPESELQMEEFGDMALVPKWIARVGTVHTQ